MSQRSLRLEARIENLEAMLAFVAESAGKLGWLGERLPNIELAVEEAAVNVCNHAYPEGEGFIELSAGGSRDSFMVVINDAGIPFDILAAPEPDLTADITEREIGGLGCFLIRSLTDRVSYRREGERNILQLEFLREKGQEC
jgi:anti-sigma regulatory factor (Ser/Thr protein kinase)